MGYYKNEFDKRGFDTMWYFLQMGQQKSNIPQFKRAIQDLIKMMTQKTVGQKVYTKDINLEENFDMTIITIVLESIALYLSGDLEKLEGEKNMEQEINKNNIEKIIKNFNEDFNANVSIKNTTLLKNIFQNFVNINMSSMISNETDIKIIELEEKIKKTLDKDSNLFEEWNKIQDNYMLNVTEQAYIYGLCTYKQLNSEIDGLNERKDNEEEQQILKHFDKIFGTKVANHIKLNIPLLKNIFEKLEEDIFKPSEKYDMLRKEQIKIADELYPTFTEKQNKLFEQYWQVTNQLNSIEDEQLFYFGYIVSKELEKEAKIIE